MADTKIDYKRTDPSKTEVVFEISIPAAAYDQQYQIELKKLAETTRVKGFRPGKAPTDIVETSHASEARSKTVEMLISHFASDVMKQENIWPATAPSVEVLSVDEDRTMHIKLTVPVIPDITIPDLKKLTTKRGSVEVTEKDTEEVIKRLWQEQRGKHKTRTNEWVKEVAVKFGFKASTLKEFQAEVAVAVRREKERVVEQKYANDILTEAIELSNVEMPDVLVDTEAADRERTFDQTLRDMKTTADEFCKTRSVTMDQMREQWKKDARDAIRTDIFLGAYARKAHLSVKPEELDAEVAAARSRSKDPSHTVFDNAQWRRYIEKVLLKRKAFSAFLSEVKEILGASPVAPTGSDTSSQASK